MLKRIGTVCLLATLLISTLALTGCAKYPNVTFYAGQEFNVPMIETIYPGLANDNTQAEHEFIYQRADFDDLAAMLAEYGVLLKENKYQALGTMKFADKTTGEPRTITSYYNDSGTIMIIVEPETVTIKIEPSDD